MHLGKMPIGSSANGMQLPTTLVPKLANAERNPAENFGDRFSTKGVSSKG